MSIYSERYRTPSPLFPKSSPTSLEKLLHSWEVLRDLNRHGYRTSSATPMSTWLVKINWADRHASGRSVGRGTTCSPFVTQATAIAYSSSDSEPYLPLLADGQPLPVLFSHAANGVLQPSHRIHRELMERYGMAMADNEWPRPIIFFNMGVAIEPEQLRRGDAVHIDWMNGGGHAVFCWDVHLNDRGEVDAFQYVSSNGSMASGGSGGGVSVGGTAGGAGGIIGRRSGATTSDPIEYFSTKQPLFVDDERYVTEGAWVTWKDDVAGKLLGDLRGRPKSRVKKVRRVAVARFHGIEVGQIPLFAMGQDVAGAVVTPRRESPPAAAPAAAPLTSPQLALSTDEARSLQRHLKLLFLIGWIHTDTGKIDGKLGGKSTAAIVAFQRAYKLKRDGKVSPLLLAKLDSVFAAALKSPQAAAYLNPAAQSGLTFASDSANDSWEDSAELYFRHGSVRPGDSIELVLTGEDLPQVPLGIVLLDADSHRPVKLEGGTSLGTLPPQGDRTSATLTVPRSLGSCQLVAAVHLPGPSASSPPPASSLRLWSALPLSVVEISL